MRVEIIWRCSLVMTVAMFFLASCCSDDNVERRLTNTQKETYGQNISGEYPGEDNSRGDRHLGYSSRHTQVPVPATTSPSAAAFLALQRAFCAVFP